jgi:hypothetical protein
MLLCFSLYSLMLLMSLPAEFFPDIANGIVCFASASLEWNRRL